MRDASDLVEKIITRLTEVMTLNTPIQAMPHDDYEKLEDDMYKIVDEWTKT